MKKLIKFEGYIPCIHENISMFRTDGDEACEIDSDWAMDCNDCGVQCPDYQARLVEVCRKHHREFVGECDDCFGEYWEKEGRKHDRQHCINSFMQKNLHIKLRYGRFDRFGGWVLDMKPKFHAVYQFDVGGKKTYRGIDITGLKRSLQVGIYL